MIASHDVQAGIDTPNPESTACVSNSTPPSDLEPYTKSSWVQSLSEIPYEDIICAHSVNSFCPLILIRELFSLMGCAKSPSSSTPTKPQGYIIKSPRAKAFSRTTQILQRKQANMYTPTCPKLR
ncbi:hypothetical protein HBH96_158470 [Parastagonospora nodorum]|nr:hypothetical protein HBH51_163610 [Parastagonospora nodorum]KAH4093639.1 hypothetical protein HBH46_175870 [Parastagonospora nodorum]KAH4117748.1 hypothetical protein HBH47_148360 [Parastagonospora nodorum]KAH4184761.1 hypothetical protein HBH42_187290 [Parastagonospora nodorum]KAH4864160.1 hypothetical protein HBH75_004130 [Parastagonospora nodorum]